MKLFLAFVLIMSLASCKRNYGPRVGNWGPFVVYARYINCNDTLFFYKAPDMHDFGFYSTDNYIKKFPR